MANEGPERTAGPVARPDDTDSDADRATRAQVEAESNTSPRTRADLDAPRSDAPETRAVPDLPSERDEHGSNASSDG